MSKKTSPAGNVILSAVARLHWQWVVLATGLLMIIGAVAFLLLNESPSGAEEPAPEVRPVDFIETQVYSEAIVGEPLLANPLLATSQADHDLVALVFSGLTRLDEFGLPIPDLAEGWRVSSDGLVYTFHLREGVTWHDGEPFTADDVAFTMSVLRDPAFPGPTDLGAFWRSVETYADDEFTVRFVLAQPLAAFPEYAGIGILPAHLLAGVSPADIAADPFNLSPTGTGRMKWTSLEESNDVTVVSLEPYEAFYDHPRRVTLQEMQLRFYESGSQAFRELGADALAMGGLTPSQLNAALGSTGLNIYTARQPVYGAVIFNLQADERLPFFQEENVRRALVMGLDRESIVNDNFGRSAAVADSPILSGTWAYNPDLEPVNFDPLKAMQLLDESGWVTEGGIRTREGQTISFTLLIGDRAADEALGQAIVDQWRALGIDVKIESLSPTELVERLSMTTGEEGRDFDAALVEFSQGRLADPDPYPFWHQSQIEEGQNYSGLADRFISEALEIARKDPNGVRRLELYQGFQERFVNQSYAVLLYNPLYHFTASCQVVGIQVMIFIDPSDRYRNLHEWRIASPAEHDRVCPN
ncbi:MAG: peptide ABC transporter substrate-binding protein [Anaerolineae bacterium]|nr:peptide ABC transporter substrate-binding protein [Anaerolineae bacterium]